MIAYSPPIQHKTVQFFNNNYCNPKMLDSPKMLISPKMLTSPKMLVSPKMLSSPKMPASPKMPVSPKINLSASPKKCIQKCQSKNANYDIR